MKKMVFLHGALGSASDFKPLTELCEGHYECFAPELPAHGQSAPGHDFSIEYFTTWFIDYLRDQFTTPVLVFGYSMGGYIALNAATRNPELFEKVMTLATKFDWDAGEGHKQAALLKPDIIAVKIPKYAAYLAQKHTASGWESLMAQTAVLIIKLAAEPNLNKQLLSELEVPVCVGLGDQDNMVSVAETHEIAKICKLGNMYMIPGMLHPIEKINAALVFEVMKDYFNRH